MEFLQSFFLSLTDMMKTGFLESVCKWTLLEFCNYGFFVFSRFGCLLEMTKLHHTLITRNARTKGAINFKRETMTLTIINHWKPERERERGRKKKLWKGWFKSANALITVFQVNTAIFSRNKREIIPKWVSPKIYRAISWTICAS